MIIQGLFCFSVMECSSWFHWKKCSNFVWHPTSKQRITRSDAKATHFCWSVCWFQSSGGTTLFCWLHIINAYFWIDILYYWNIYRLHSLMGFLVQQWMIKPLLLLCLLAWPVRHFLFLQYLRRYVNSQHEYMVIWLNVRTSIYIA